MRVSEPPYERGTIQKTVDEVRALDYLHPRLTSDNHRLQTRRSAPPLSPAAFKKRAPPLPVFPTILSDEEVEDTRDSEDADTRRKSDDEEASSQDSTYPNPATTEPSQTQELGQLSLNDREEHGMSLVPGYDDEGPSRSILIIYISMLTCYPVDMDIDSSAPPCAPPSPASSICTFVILWILLNLILQTIQ